MWVILHVETGELLTAREIHYESDTPLQFDTEANSEAFRKAYKEGGSCVSYVYDGILGSDL